MRRDLLADRRRRGAARPWACRSCPTCRSSSRPRGRRLARGLGGVAPPRAAVRRRAAPAAGAPSKTSTSRTFGVWPRIFANSARDSASHPDEDGIAVVDDVGRLFGREPVVERHGGGADLARRVHHRNDPGRVHAAPHDLVARAGRRARAAAWPRRFARSFSSPKLQRATGSPGDRRSRRASRAGCRRGG